MQQLDYLTELLGFQGFKVPGIETRQVKGIETVAIDLQRQGNVYICSGCGKEVTSNHSSWTQEVRHLHLWKYLTVLRFQKVLYVGEGRKEKDLKPFWRWFGEERAKNITHAVMDMATGFINSFRANRPSIKIIYDKFHVMRHLLNALNEVRKAEFKKAGKKWTAQQSLFMA